MSGLCNAAAKPQQDVGRIARRRLGKTPPKKAALWSFGVYRALDVYRALNGVPCGNPGIQSSMQGPNLFKAVIHQNLGDPRG
jgi:hypothetical protein